MNFEDATVVALADESTREGVFDDESLLQLLACAYDAEAMGPFQGDLVPLFEEFEIGFAAPSFATVDGTWSESGGTQRTEANMRIAGLGGVSAPRVDALWRGAIMARYADTGETILEPVDVAWPRGEEIDAAVAAANGGTLPSGAALENARRDELLASLRTQFGDTTAPFRLDEDELRAIVKSAGATSVGNFLAHAQEADRATAVLELLFSEPAEVAPTRRPLPVTVALLVRDEPLPVADLLQDTARVRERLAQLGVERPRANGAAPRHPVVVAWVVPASTFDDEDWPGADQEERRTQAGEWLARQGIGLVAVP